MIEHAPECMAEACAGCADEMARLLLQNQAVSKIVECAIAWRKDPGPDREGDLAAAVDTVIGGPLAVKPLQPWTEGQKQALAAVADTMLSKIGNPWAPNKDYPGKPVENRCTHCGYPKESPAHRTHCPQVG